LLLRRNQRTHAFKYKASEARQLNLVRPAIEKPPAKFTFQDLNATSQSGLRHMQVFGSVDEAAMSGNGLKLAEAFEVHALMLTPRYRTCIAVMQCTQSVDTQIAFHRNRLGCYGGRVDDRATVRWRNPVITDAQRKKERQQEKKRTRPTGGSHCTKVQYPLVMVGSTNRVVCRSQKTTPKPHMVN